MWRLLAATLHEQAAPLRAFLGDFLRDARHRVILTGAGTSSFIGEIAADGINQAWPAEVRAVASTSLLTHPELYLQRGRPTLLVNFARSGNSPESQASVDLLRACVDRPRFLNITCNGEGLLARRGVGRADTFNLILPAATCDRGFAMTSSFSTMLLAALAVFGDHTAGARIGQLADSADKLLPAWEARLAELGAAPFERIVYLGSGPLEALAKEAALKILELTAGRVLALAHTSMGLRHGPKSALNERTLVVQFQSQDPHAQRYDASVFDELQRDGVAGRLLAFTPDDVGAPAGLPDAWLAALYVLLAQQLALHKSAALGLTPDNPFPDGTVNRVVQGVTIYPYAGA
jgi:tagatose-6-phosphate ketose/aldose isomerase